MAAASMQEDGGGQADEDRRLGAAPPAPTAETPAIAPATGAAPDASAPKATETPAIADTAAAAGGEVVASDEATAGAEAEAGKELALPDGEAAPASPAKKKGCVAFCGVGKKKSTAAPNAKSGKKTEKVASPGGKPEEIGSQDKPRYWDLTVAARSMEIVADDMVDAFFAVKICVDNPKIQRNHVKLLAEYTPAFVLLKGDRKTLDVPITLYDRKTFRLSYNHLRKHMFRIDMWKVSKCSFNSYYARGQRSLYEIASKPSNMSIRLKKKYTTKDEAENEKKRRKAPDMALFDCTVNLEELFDFQLQCENWSLSLEVKKGKEQKKEYEKRMGEKKILTFVVPKHYKANATANRSCSQLRSEWVGALPGQSIWGWNRIGKQAAVFRGTRTDLSNKFFIAVVHSGNPPSKSLPPMGASIGKSLMGLTSVLDISVFKGTVKALDAREDRFYVGTITGSVRCAPFSKGEKKVEDIQGGRPEQPKSSLSVTHLDPQEKHLVIFVRKCEGLAVADADKGTSDPCLRCVWDNMVQKSPTLKSTIRPVFNQAFYFPVRLFNNHCLDRRYQETALVYEYVSKGDINIQVWDDDETSADSLGSILLPLRSLLASKTYEARTLRGPPPKKEDGEVNEFAKPAKKQWYEVERRVRVYDGSGMELTGGPPGTTTPIIHFETYFYPDTPSTLTIPKKGEGKEEKWREKEKAWNRTQVDFQKNYAAPFPESIGAKRHMDNSFQRTEHLRRFTGIVLHPQTRAQLPLSALLVRIITPKEYAQPAVLMHWINCVTFFSSPRQIRTGQIPADGWKDPQYLLFRRMGPAQDHAILLCSVLLGCGKDAYVCKGTVWVQDDAEGAVLGTASKSKSPPRLVEHAWVMTREAAGFVTFWESCTREMYHLPHRYTPKKKKKGQKKEDAAAALIEDEEEETALAVQEEVWDDEVADAQILAEDYESLPTIGRMPRPKAKVDKNKGKGARDKLQEKLMRQRENLLMAPNKAMLRDGDYGSESGTLVDWLPYDSLDTVFNMENLWSNHQSHHPACVTFDFEDTTRWTPLVTKEESKTLTFSPVCGDVLIDPQLKPEQLLRLEQDMEGEIQENMRLYRNKRGFDTFFDMRKPLKSLLEQFLDIHEDLRRLDIDLCPIWEKPDRATWTEEEKYLLEQLKFGRCDRPYNRYGTPSSVDPDMAAYKEAQTAAWEKVKGKVKQFRASEKYFPVRKGKCFTGLPVHFCTADKEAIRAYLMANKTYCDMMDKETDGQMLYTVHCKIYGLLGGIQSTWLYFGVQIPMEEMGEKE